MSPTPAEQAIIDAALQQAAGQLQANAQTVMTVYGNGVITSQSSGIKIVKGSQ